MKNIINSFIARLDFPLHPFIRTANINISRIEYEFFFSYNFDESLEKERERERDREMKNRPAVAFDRRRLLSTVFEKKLFPLRIYNPGFIGPENGET